VGGIRIDDNLGVAVVRIGRFDSLNLFHGDGGIHLAKMETDGTCHLGGFVQRSYWIPGSWNLRMSYTDDIPFPNP
jgi:hypothetical protein